MIEECVFCKIVAGAPVTTFNARSETSVAITPEKMGVRGHQLVIPKQHYESIYDIPRDVLADVMQFTQEVALAMRSQQGVEGVNLLHASGSAAQQSIPHFHLHLLPRFQGDGIDAWPRLPGSVEGLGKFWPELT